MVEMLKTPAGRGLSEAGDRVRTGDLQLGRLSNDPGPRRDSGANGGHLPESRKSTGGQFRDSGALDTQLDTRNRASDEPLYECDCCDRRVPESEIVTVIAYGIETNACARCRGER